MIRNISVITASSYLSMLFLGVAATLIGAAARNIGLSPYQIGLMITFQNLGFMLSVMISGALADTHEKPRILLIGSLILTAAFLSFYLTQIFNVNLFIMFMIGLGIGTYEGVTDAMLIDIHPKKENQRALVDFAVEHVVDPLDALHHLARVRIDKHDFAHVVAVADFHLPSQVVKALDTLHEPGSEDHETACTRFYGLCGNAR